MTTLERHRFILYGRIGVSLTSFIAAMVLGVTEAVSAGTGPTTWVLGGLLIMAVLLMPRRPVPRNEEIREEASDDELDHFRRIQTWSNWARIAYLTIAIGVLLGLPRLL